MWDRVNAIQDSVEGKLKPHSERYYASRYDRDELQKIYENQVRARVELGQFLNALRECDSPEYHAINAKLITAAQQIDEKLEQIVTTLETEMNVPSMSLPAMAQHMQYESQHKQNAMNMIIPLITVLNYCGSICQTTILNGRWSEFGGGEYLRFTGNAGPVSSHDCII